MTTLETSLLVTKLLVPRASPGLVVRTHLIQTLRGALDSRLVLVSAPAGYGKTTVLSQWIQRSGVPCAWLTLEEPENDPVRFWDYVIGALRTIFPDVGSTASSLLHSSQPVAVDSVLTQLVNSIARLPPDFALVLDDYHSIESQAVHQGVVFLLDHLPPKMHLIVATREDPPWPVARFRGKGIMLEIGANDLRLSEEEASGLLRTIVGQEVSARDVQAINARAEGWAVGVKMAGLSLSRQTDISQSVRAFAGSQRYVMDYLMDEVLRRQPASKRDFLLRTSVLGRLCGPLCDAVTQRSGGRETLLDLEKSNLFTIPLDEAREWYRYHHLFADLLGHRRDTELGKKTADELHLRASQWYEDNGLLEDAVNHALAARDWGRAMDIIGRPAVLIPRMRTQTLLNWLQRVPEEVLRTNTDRYVNYAWSLQWQGQYAAVEEALKYLETVATGDTHLQGTIANLRASIAAGRGDNHHAEAYARAALRLLGADDLNEQAVASLALGVSLMMQGRSDEAESFLRESAALFQRAGSAANTVLSLIWLGVAQFGQGRFQEAVGAYTRAIELAGDDPVTGMAHQGLGSVHYLWNDLAASAMHFRRAIELRQYTSDPVVENACLGLARTLAAQGDADGAGKALEAAESLRSGRGADAGRAEGYAGGRAAVALLLGNREAASRWVSGLAEPDVFQLLIASVSAVRLFWSKKDRRTVTDEAEALRQECRRGGSLAGVACVRIIQALDSLGPDSPMDCLAEALSICRPVNVVRVFVDVGVEMVPLLRQAVSTGVEPEFARKVLNIIEAGEMRRVTAGAKGIPIPQSSEVLSLRELEVLGLAAEGLSNRQIAEKLTVSLNTIKTHMRHVTEKLGAGSRTQTIARARSLKLL